MASRTLTAPVAPATNQRRIDPITIALWVSLLVAALFWLIPLLFIIFTSFKTRADLMQGSPFSLPKTFTFANYEAAWKTGKFTVYGLNSLIISATKPPINMFIAALAAFALSRLRFRFQRGLFLFFVMGTMIPVQVALGPIFTMILNAGLLSTYLGILLPYIAFGLPYQIFLFHGFFKAIPRDLDEAAKIDGCSAFGLLFRIILPLSLPILGAVFILDFVATWNEFAIALVILSSSSSWTIPLGLTSFQGQFTTNYGALNAAIVLSILPVILVYLIFQRYFVAGLTTGAVKG